MGGGVTFSLLSPLELSEEGRGGVNQRFWSTLYRSADIHSGGTRMNAMYILIDEWQCKESRGGVNVPTW